MAATLPQGFEVSELAASQRPTGLWAAGLLRALAREEVAGRRTRRLTEPGLPTWERFRILAQFVELSASREIRDHARRRHRLGVGVEHREREPLRRPGSEDSVGSERLLELGEAQLAQQILACRWRWRLRARGRLVESMQPESAHNRASASCGSNSWRSPSR